MWENLSVSNIANWIILVSAVIIASKNIYAFFKKPVDTIQERAKANEEKHIEEVLEEKMPKILEKNCETILGSINELKEMTLSQEERLINLQDSMDLMNQAQLDSLRYNMNNLYYKYRPYKKILDADKKAFMKFYKDYHSMGGNTWIDSLYEEIITWEIVESESELKT